ncbi:MAG TPA: YicC/YloC family endoribonuclease [Bacteroidota bacterium]|nr:YicC/YloC family endoribonuclease [Bacteroidota bacterium]
MTGFGRGEASASRTSAVAEVRTVNNRFLEVTSRLPRTLALRENDVKELVRAKIGRGKVNVVVTLEQENENEFPLRINTAAAKSYYKLLKTLSKSANINEKITLEHLLHFPEVIETDVSDEGDDREWTTVQKALNKALDEAVKMRAAEGAELMKDLKKRLKSIEDLLTKVERHAETRLPQELEKLQERLKELLTDTSVIDKGRLELEVALLADKLDVTEECVRFRSHNKFFLEGLAEKESAGRKLNFLVQEMNREANTIGSKANNAEIAHIIVLVKEELEKIREQLQNIE